jgi:hypothetical protein
MSQTVLVTGATVIPYSPDQVDTAKPDEQLLQESA